jgi:NAD(P)-dependent dehydrogenase (short-subunit alcohol dehydrogenase family)
MPSLDGKVAIVTGAGRGIGREHALHLARAGATVIVNDLGSSLDGQGGDSAPGQEVVEEITAAGGRAFVNGADVADFDAAASLVQQAVEELGRLDILVLNAGILRDRMLFNMSEEDWDAVIRVHLKGHFAPLRHAAAHWRALAKAGEPVQARVITTASPSGLFGNMGQANYGAAKAGIASLTVIAAQELAGYGVTVNCVAPNARTRMTEKLFESPSPDEADPLDPAHNAKIVVALCADEAQGITGQVFHVLGGAINCLQGWGPGEMLESAEGWTPDDLLRELLDRFPDGRRPIGMAEAMSAVGARGAVIER